MILVLAEAEEVGAVALSRSAGFSADNPGKQLNGGIVIFDHDGQRLAADEIEHRVSAAQRFSHFRLAATMSEEGKQLHRRVADEFDIVINGVEHKIELARLERRIERAQPFAQSIVHRVPQSPSKSRA